MGRDIVQEIYGELTRIMRDFFDDDDIVATSELTADEVDGWDSLAHIRLMLTMEREFKVKFTAAEVSSFKNVGDLADALARKTSRG